MSNDLEWLNYQLARLRERCAKLERENFELKRCIGDAIGSLEKNNQNTREYIENENKNILKFEPDFKKPKWENKQ